MNWTIHKYSFKQTFVFSFLFLLIYIFGNNIDGSFFQLNLNYLLPDSYSYIQASKNFYGEFQIDPIRPFLYPLIIGVPSIFGFNSSESIILFAVFINLVVWFFTLFYLYKTIEIIQSKKAAFWSTLILSSCFGITGMIFQPLTEICFIGLLTSGAYFLIKVPHLPSNIGLFLGFILTASLIRPGVL